MLLAERGAVMREIAGILRIGDQHRIVDRRHGAEAGPHQHFQLIFRVEEDLHHAGILEHRRQGAEHRRLAQLRRILEAEIMLERHIGGAAGRRGERDADQIAMQRLMIVGLHIQRQFAAPLRLGDEGFQRFHARDGGVAAERRRVARFRGRRFLRFAQS